jgi:hypothetical protein
LHQAVTSKRVYKADTAKDKMIKGSQDGEPVKHGVSRWRQFNPEGKIL